MIARYGGEEFLICFPDTNLAQARKLCDELRTAVEHREWACIGLDRNVTISFGIAEWGNRISQSAHSSTAPIYASTQRKTTDATGSSLDPFGISRL